MSTSTFLTAFSRRAGTYPLLACLWLGNCSGPLKELSRQNKGDPPALQGVEADEEGLILRVGELAEGQGGSERQTPNKAVEGQALTPSEQQKLLARLPAMPADTKAKALALRGPSQPPPRGERKVEAVFPPKEAMRAKPKAEGGRLEVLRVAPQGKVELAPKVSITFSHPMVALSSQQDAASKVPLRLTPKVAGRWRWLGTQTLVFENSARMPMATSYEVEVPAGTRSAEGLRLAKGKRWSFRTPPPRLVESWPQGEPARRDEVLMLGFDQKVDARALLPKLSLRAGGKTYGVRIAEAKEIPAKSSLRTLLAASSSTHRLLFKPAEALPSDSEVEVVLAAGAPSAEGPLQTEREQSFRFRTYAGLRIEESNCQRPEECPPLSAWYVRFNNPLDPARFDKKALVIEPELPESKVEIYGNAISIQGRSRGRTTYRVRFPEALVDTFGQRLGKAETREFRMGSAPAAMMAPSGMVVGDPRLDKPQVHLSSVNVPRVKLRVYRVKASDWPAYLAFGRKVANERRWPEPPGTKLWERTQKLEGAADEWSESVIDLSSALPQRWGHVLVLLESEGVKNQGPYRGMEAPRTHFWFQSTAIGLDAFVDAEKLWAWATSLKDGAALSDVDFELLPSGSKQRSARGALASLPLPAQGGRGGMLIARRGKDVALLPEFTDFWSESSNWKTQSGREFLRWFVFDDRAMYRPGESVHLKGWLRRFQPRDPGEPRAPQSVSKLSYRVVDSQEREIGKGTASLSKQGGFDLRFALPETPNLGYARVELKAATSLEGGDYVHSFQIQEFRRPEYEVSVRNSEAPHRIGARGWVELEAKYYAGGALANAEARWQLQSTVAEFRPPNHEEYQFGRYRPWWEPFFWRPAPPPKTLVYRARTDGQGKHRLRIDFVASNPPEPQSLVAEASVQDVNRQEWSGRTTLLVHPASVYVGLKLAKAFLGQGETIEVRSIVVDTEGKAVAGRSVEIRSARLDWEQEGDEWKQKEKASQSCTLRSRQEAADCRFQAKEGGVYKITALVRDEAGRTNQSEAQVWVAGGKMPPSRELGQQNVQLIPDKKEYRPGEEAKVLVQSPFYPAEAIMTLRRDGIRKEMRFSMRSPSYTLRIPIRSGDLPNVHVQVDLAGSSVEGKTRRPAFASGTLSLPVSLRERALRLRLTPAQRELEPGGKTKLAVEVKDAEGKAVSDAEVAVVVVDEAVLALSGYAFADPLKVFYEERPSGVVDYRLRSFVQLGDPLKQNGAATGGMREQSVMRSMAASADAEAAPAPRMAQKKMAPGGEGASEGKAIALRKDLTPLALFAPALRSDAQGRAEVEIRLPDNLTRYRIFAAAVQGERHFGKGESTLTARLPLMVRPSAPRFLNYGDRFELPVVVQNQSGRELDVQVALRSQNLKLSGSPGRKLHLRARERVELRFPAETEGAGQALVQVGAAAAGVQDAAEIRLPVWTPATTEAFATYGVVENKALAQPLALPSDAMPDFGGLELSLASTQLHSLSDAFLDLVGYPFECGEQLASRVLAIAALGDALAALAPESKDKAGEMKARVERDLQALRSLQNGDGGFPFWRRGDPSWPFVSVHVAHAAALAKSKGFAVPAELLERSRAYLREVANRFPSDYPAEVKRSIRAYALEVRRRMGDADPKAARALLREAKIEEQPLEALAWLLPTLHDDKGASSEREALRRHLGNRVSETAGNAHFVTSYGDGAYLLLHSDRRVDALMLEALIYDQPQSDLIPKLLRGLLAHRVRGKWSSTQENVFVLLALGHYFESFEKTPPAFTARAWLGVQGLLQQRFQGHKNEEVDLKLPMLRIASTKTAELLLNREGKGRLYYRLGLRYAPRDLKVGAADYGFTVERRYEAVDHPDDVKQERDGSYRVRAGARVRVRIQMVASDRRYHVALVDPLPAGLEALQGDLKVSATTPVDALPLPGRRGKIAASWPSFFSWFQHQNFRDERVEAFTTLLWEGVHEYSYLARATTPGDFVIPPAKAEEMYHPETFGRSASQKMRIQ